jgi:hypothetical protein
VEQVNINKNAQTLIDASKEVGIVYGIVYVGVTGPERRPKSGNENRKQII